MYPGPRTDINNMVCTANSVFIVLHYQHGITHVSQMGECGQKPLVVPLVEANRWLIQNVHNAHKASANLRGQTYTLGFTARQCFGTAV